MATTPEEGTEGTGATAFEVAPPTRQRVADHVFETLAKAILNGSLKPGSALPTQRELARQFNISALVVRQAIHRLEDLGLVRVRQGSATIVLDPAESTDIRLIQLQMELSEAGPKLSAAVMENQALFLIPLIALAERRCTPENLAVLKYLVEKASGDITPAEAAAFRMEYWTQIAKAGRNPLFQQQVRWWRTLMVELDKRGREMRVPAHSQVLAFYRQLNEKLEQRSGAVELYLGMIRPVLDWAEARLKAQDNKAAAKEGGAAKEAEPEGQGASR